MENKEKYTKEEAEEITQNSLNKIKLLFGQNVNVDIVDRSVVVWSSSKIMRVFNFDGSRNINRSLKEMALLGIY